MAAAAPPSPPPARPQPVSSAQRSLAETVSALSKEQIDERLPAPLWTRFLAGALIVVISMATATAVSAIAFLADFAEGLSDHSGVLKGVENRLAGVDGGEPQTILILGSDIRPGEDAGRSDTTMLLRLDADRNVISLFSLPRDLKVNIPGVGIDKLNAAYSYGGPKKTLEVVQQITGLEVNHLVNVDFNGFAKAVDAIDCVYVDVDRDYFHSNVGLAASEQYSEIDVSAGYQRLCGLRALQFVRYRHTDNDIVRSARQQDFLREARQKVPPGRLFSDRDELVKIFTDHTTSDIDDLPTLIGVLKLFVEARNAPVNQIHFEGAFEESYVTASNSQMKQAVAEFLGETETPATRAPSSAGGGKGKGKKRKPKPAPGGATPMTESGAETLAFVELMARRKRMPAYLPSQIAPGSFFDDESRGYKIRLPNQKFDDAYKLVFQIGGRFGVPEYYGVMATEWRDPPILENPSETRTIDGREYMLFYDSDRLRLVAFKTNRGSYWVSNTLLQSLSEQQMIAIATSMDEVKA